MRFEILVLLSVFAFIVSAKADYCTEHVKDVPLKSLLATASSWPNLRRQPGSIVFESNAIFQRARTDAAALTPPPDFCPKLCTISKKPVLFFRSTPNKVRTEYDAAADCAELEASTQRNPFRYQTSALNSIEELNEWIGELSQGKGANGRDLYNRCAGECSPRYEYTIVRPQQAPPEYRVDAAVVCGAARDKDDNQYALESFFRWTCNRANRPAR